MYRMNTEKNKGSKELYELVGQELNCEKNKLAAYRRQ